MKGDAACCFPRRSMSHPPESSFNLTCFQEEPDQQLQDRVEGQFTEEETPAAASLGPARATEVQWLHHFCASCFPEMSSSF